MAVDAIDALKNYNITWNTQSRNSGESMPLGGNDIGCNVWVENNKLFVYMAQSGAFDSYGNMLKAGRLCISFEEDVFRDGFRQQLILQEGCINITGKWANQQISIQLWNEVHRSALHISMDSTAKISCHCRYENWRAEDLTHENYDTILPQKDSLIFYHRNLESNLLNARLAEQNIEFLHDFFPDVEKNRTSGGKLIMPNMAFEEKKAGCYLDTAFMGYSFKTVHPQHTIHIDAFFCVNQAETIEAWMAELSKIVLKTPDRSAAKDAALTWWKDFWNRSYVWIDSTKNSNTESLDQQAGRNYQLFRYMLASNAYGEFPTKFNGGLFTVDQSMWHTPKAGATPDYREWGGIMFTAQNQRLVYWPMIKNGDFDMMKPQFDFYKRLVTPLKKRTQHFFGLEDCACFPEQIDANGLSGYYGLWGVDYPLQVRHHYVEALEFCYMIICYHKTSGNDISPYMAFIKSVIDFYDKKYSAKDNGKRILFPSTALETYHGDYLTEVYGQEGRYAANYEEKQTAVTNPADVIAALSTTISALLALDCLSFEDANRYQSLLQELPEIPTEIKHGKQVIAPCEYPKDYKKGNCEFPQLNTVYPYKIYGVFSDSLRLATDTYWYGWDDEDQLDYISWHPNGCYAARLGLTEEAHKYMRLKLADSGRRFPAFWGPGHDYTPDFNWGGSGMAVVQEMLLQTYQHTIYLLPAWPRHLDVSFKLWADENTIVTAEYKNQVLHYSVTPASRAKDIIVNPAIAKAIHMKS